MRTLFAIVNGHAGGGRCGKRAPAALERLRASGITLTVRETRKPGDGTSLAREAFEDGHRAFLAVGGDGTSFEVVNGIFPHAASEGVTLGILPLGTGNSFLRDFGITDPDAALAAVVRGATHPCDVVRVRHRDGELHYINLLSVGFSAHAGALMNRRFKPLGHAGYVFSVLGCLARLRHETHEVRLDGAPVDARKAALLSFSNSRFTGGAMMMAPHADVGDGKLDVIRVGELGRMAFVGAFPRIFRGTHLELRDVSETQAREVAFDHPRDEDVMVDGEVLRLCLEQLTVLPHALEVLA